MIISFVFLAAIVSSLALPASDFVVVGAGTAGCTIAATLCKQLKRATITLVERGAHRTRTDRLQSESAANIITSWFNPNLTSSLPTEPNRALGGRVISIQTGANIGGGSAVNAGQLLLPPAGTFDKWGIANLSDARAEYLFWKVLRPAQPGTGVPPPALWPKFSSEWRRSSIASGLPFETRPFKNPRTSSSTFDTRLTFDRQGKRVNACQTFLEPVLNGVCRGRVRVLRGMRAERVLFKKGRTARSVELTRVSDGKKLRLFARREILIASGAIESAALLLRSGVGPRAEIKNRVRQFVRDLPVGKRLQVRPTITVSSFYRGPLADVNNPEKLASAEALRDFRAGRGGVLGTSPFGPMMRVAGIGYGFALIGQFPQQRGQPIVTSACVVDVSHNSFGSVRLPRGRGPAYVSSPPLLNLRMLERADDVHRATLCLARMREIQKQLNPLINGVELFGQGQSAQTLATQKGLVAKVKAEAGIAPHYAGSCAVGQVVDRQLRVYGVQRLRVVDTAAIPRLPKTSGPMASVYIVALHAGEMLADQHRDLV